VTRDKWLPSLAVLAATTGAGALLGMALRPPFWPLFLALLLAGLAALGWLARARDPVRSLPRPRMRKPKAKSEDYDLESDTRTDDQRWLM
jgi:hypothetical protein